MPFWKKKEKEPKPDPADHKPGPWPPPKKRAVPEYDGLCYVMDDGSGVPIDVNGFERNKELFTGFIGHLNIGQSLTIRRTR